jgi:hypothetical protein
VTQVLRAALAATLLVAALGMSGAASGAQTYTGPVAGVPWTPTTLPAAVVGVPYTVTISAAPAGAATLLVECTTKSLGTFPPPPLSLDECTHLPDGLTATGGSSLTISGTPTTDGDYGFRLMALWQDASGGYFYSLQNFSMSVSSTAQSPKCHCQSVGVTVTSAVATGSKLSLTATLALQCSSGSGTACKGTATLRAPAGGSWKTMLLPGDDTPQPVRAKAAVPLSCFGPCGHGATVVVHLVGTRGPGNPVTIPVVPTCAGRRASAKSIVLQFDARGRLDSRHSKRAA